MSEKTTANPLAVLQCPFRVTHPLGHACQVAAQRYGRPIPIHETQCAACVGGKALEVQASIDRQMATFGRATLERTREAPRLAALIPPPPERDRIKLPARWAVAVMAAPRPKGVDYLPRTLASLRRAGWYDITIFAEPGTLIPPGETVVSWPVQMGNWGNQRGALNYLLNNRTLRADLLVVTEDDFEVDAGLCEWLEGNLWPSKRCGMVNLFAVNDMGIANRPPGWHRYSNWGNQFTIWRPEAAHEHLCNRLRPEWKELHKEELMADIAYQQTFPKMGWEFWYPIAPGGASVLKHTGGVSACWEKHQAGLDANRRELRYTGDPSYDPAEFLPQEQSNSISVAVPKAVPGCTTCGGGVAKLPEAVVARVETPPSPDVEWSHDLAAARLVVCRGCPDWELTKPDACGTDCGCAGTAAQVTLQTIGVPDTRCPAKPSRWLNLE